VKIRPEFGEKYIFAQNQIFAVLPEMSSRLWVCGSVVSRNRAAHAGRRLAHGCLATGAGHMTDDTMREGDWNSIRSGGANCAPRTHACCDSAWLFSSLTHTHLAVTSFRCVNPHSFFQCSYNSATDRAPIGSRDSKLYNRKF
jgi:hypothetical protein